jgi:hypothetical protein
MRYRGENLVENSVNEGYRVIVWFYLTYFKSSHIKYLILIRSIKYTLIIK